MTVHTATGLLVDFMPGAGPFDVPDDFYLSLTGTALGTSGGSKATTPDVAALDITGDIDVRIDLDADRWVAPSGVLLKLIGKGDFGASDRSWVLYTDVNRKLVFRWTTNGTTSIDSLSTIPIPVISGRLAVRVTLDVDDGAGNRVTTFYTAPTINGSWTQLGSTVTAVGTTSIWNSATALEIGDVIGSGFPSVKGRCYAAEVRNGIASSVVANPDFTAQPPGTTSFADAAGRTWTVNSPSTIAGFTWVDITDKATKGRVSWTVGRGDELAAFPPGTADLVLDNDDRLFDPTHTAGTYFGKLNPRTPFRIRSISSALRAPGVGGATASTPDHASFNITDLDVRVRCAMDDWTPGGFGQFLAGQWPGGVGNQAWHLAVGTTGVLSLGFTTDGSTVLTRVSTVPTGFTNGTDHWVRVTLDADNGAAGHDVRFYTSTDGITWTQLGSTVTTAGVVAVFNSTAALAVGDVLALAGYVRYLEVRSGIGGTIVANPEFNAQRPGTTSFRDRAGRTWTVNGSASILSDPTVATDQFYGFAVNGFVQDSSPPAKGDCAIHLVDMIGVLNGSDLPATAYEAEVMADVPAANWRLDETAGTQMADSSGNGRHGFYDNSILGRDPLITGSGHSVEFPHVGDNRGRFQGEGLPVAAPCSLEAWVKTPRDAAAVKSAIVVQRDASLGAALWFGISTSGLGSPNGELQIDFAGLGTGYKARGHVRVDDNNPHHVMCTIAGNLAADVLLYVDGVAQTKTTISGTNPGPWPSLLLWTVGNYTDNGFGDFGFDGLLDEVAVYDYVLDPTRVTAHYQAGHDGFDGEATGTRINRVLDLVGVPESLRDIATGDTFSGPADYGSRSAGAYIQAVVESEQGVFFVDHRNGGKLKFRGRYARLTETRSTAALWAFTDADAVGNLHYERKGLKVDPNAASGIVNVVRVGWRGGTETVVDTASKDAYGPQERHLSTDAPTPEAARSAGNWLTNRYGQPQERVRGFQLQPDADKRLWTAALDLQVSDRITVGRHPQQVGSSVVGTLTVEGVTHTAEGTRWSTEVRTSVAVLGDVWIWGTSTWGETTVWG